MLLHQQLPVQYMLKHMLKGLALDAKTRKSGFEFLKHSAKCDDMRTGFPAC